MTTTKQHGSKNIWIDSAIEALMQAREEDSSLSVMLVLHANNKSGVLFNGEVSHVAAALVHFAKQEEPIAKIMQIAEINLRLDKHDDFGKFLDKLEDYLDELRKNRPEEE